MKLKNNFYKTTIILLFISYNSVGQKIIDTKFEADQKIVEHLNTPTKIWISGKWEAQLNGVKIWKKGHWGFKERSFEQKSKILRKKLSDQKKA